MELIKAIILSLGEVEEPVITSYRLGLILHNLYKYKEYKSESIPKPRKPFAERKDFNKHLNTLLGEGVLNYYKGLPKSVFSLLGRSHHSAEDIACTVDPFCYVSDLSAMGYHGLTNRMPAKLFISSPDIKEWKAFAIEKMGKELKDDFETYIQNKLPRLVQHPLKKIGKKEIHRFSSVHWGAYKNVQGRSMRVATIGRTFLEMLRNPELCGGINHVLEVYAEYAEKYLRLITDEIDRHGTPIEKVRAGYIIEERLGIQNTVVESWIQHAQRGGSRKLDASAEYIAQWSDKWCLSLNIFE